MPRDTNFGKVVVHTLESGLFQGFSKSELLGEVIEVIDPKGNGHKFQLSDLKAVFFVEDFDGDPKHDELRFLHKSPKTKWLWGEVEFLDGEVLEGRIQNTLEFLDGPGFFLWPSDETANTKLVYISKSAISDFRILGFY